MKTKFLVIAGFATCLTFSSLNAATIFFGIGAGHEDHHFRHHYSYATCYRPVVVYHTEPFVVEQQVHVVTTTGQVPYGYLNGGMVKSPWSDFTMSVGGKASGQIVYDPNTGQAFRIP
jgi:hypothetical protein